MATVLTGILTLLSLFAAAAEDEGRILTDPIWSTLPKLFYLFRFPTHTIFWYLMVNSGRLALIFFLGGLIINCCFYGFLMERVVAVFRLAAKKVFNAAKNFY